MNIKLEKKWTVTHNGEIYGLGYSLWQALQNAFIWWRHKAWQKRMENLWMINEECPSVNQWRHIRLFRKSKISIIPRGALKGVLK